MALPKVKDVSVVTDLLPLGISADEVSRWLDEGTVPSTALTRLKPLLEAHRFDPARPIGVIRTSEVLSVVFVGEEVVQ